MPRVLIVEDDINICQLVAINLSKRGYEMLEAQTVQDGLDLLKKYNPDMLILDIRMPSMSGWEMLRFIDSGSELTKLPVITITASVLDDRDAYPYPNIVARLIKPFDIPKLLDVTRACIGL